MVVLLQPAMAGLERRLRGVSLADDRDEYQQIALVDFRRWVRVAARHEQALSTDWTWLG